MKIMLKRATIKEDRHEDGSSSSSLRASSPRLKKKMKLILLTITGAMKIYETTMNSVREASTLRTTYHVINTSMTDEDI